MRTLDRPTRFRFFPSLWDAENVQRLTLTEQGIFMSLLVDIFNSKGRLADADWICISMRIRKATWEKARAKFLEGPDPLIYIKDGYIFNDYISAEYKRGLKIVEALNFDYSSLLPEPGHFETIHCKDTEEICYNYPDYLKSRHWKGIKERYFAQFTECEVCGKDERLHLHHKTYENVGNETLDDLILLCAGCHCKVHKIFW